MAIQYSEAVTDSDGGVLSATDVWCQSTMNFKTVLLLIVSGICRFIEGMLENSPTA